jgi:hypothetical protein
MDSSLMETDEEPVEVDMMTDRPIGSWLKETRDES